MVDAKYHKAREKEHLANVQYAVKHKLYDMAFRSLVWAHAQSVAAEEKGMAEAREKRLVREAKLEAAKALTRKSRKR